MQEVHIFNKEDDTRFLREKLVTLLMQSGATCLFRVALGLIYCLMVM